jgi:hypothetical protein
MQYTETNSNSSLNPNQMNNVFTRNFVVSISIHMMDLQKAKLSSLSLTSLAANAQQLMVLYIHTK